MKTMNNVHYLRLISVLKISVKIFSVRLISVRFQLFTEFSMECSKIEPFGGKRRSAENSQKFRNHCYVLELFFFYHVYDFCV